MLTLHSSPFGELGARDTGGMSVYVRELAWELGRRGCRVDLFTRRGPAGPDTVRPAGPNVRLVPLDGGGREDDGKLGLYPRLPEFLRSLEAFRAADGGDYDLVHSHYWLSGCLGAAAAARWGAPHAVTFHTLGVAKNRSGCGELEPELRLSEEEALATGCDRVLAPTSRERGMLIRYCGAPPRRVAVVPCGVRLDRFRPLDRRASRERLGLAAEDRVLLYVGRFSPVKGAERLLEAFAAMGRGPRTRLLLVGGDGPGSPSTAALELRARCLGISGEVSFLGRVDQGELPNHYSAADLLVLPSHYESFGLVALEALACGTPVAATRVGVAADLLDPSVNGLLLEGDPGALACGLEEALRRARAGAWPRSGVRASVSAYGWDRVADAVLREYQDLAAAQELGESCAAAASGGEP
ncbi:MAG: glycosyltransferase [Deferrisomatales bacterium]